MKNLFLLLIAFVAAACAEPHLQGVPAEWHGKLDAALVASERGEELKALLESIDRTQRKEMAFLLIHMPEGDRKGMELELLKENVAYAHLARERFPWAQQLPEERYLGDVLPYAVVNEVRDSWRPELYALFTPEVEGCGTMHDAVQAVNSRIARLTGVEYNTLREKTNQSPRESMRQGMASCTGLAILLVDALRAVGIPARFAGTAAWHDNRGNHSWTEVWLDGAWRITEYYPPKEYDHLWFMADALKASPDDRTHAIYATRFAGGDDWFPMVWAGEEETPIGELPRWVGAENVTQHYIDLARKQQTRDLEAGTHTLLRIAGYRKAGQTRRSEDRVAIGVDIFRGDEQMGGGLTADKLQDMNDFFTILLPQNTEYELRYLNGAGEPQSRQIKLGSEPARVDVFLN